MLLELLLNKFTSFTFHFVPKNSIMKVVMHLSTSYNTNNAKNYYNLFILCAREAEGRELITNEINLFKI